MLRILLILSSMILFNSCNNGWKPKSYYNNYFNAIPAEKPILVLPNLVNTPFNERDAALSPDGQMLVYSFKFRNRFVLLYTELVKGIWTQPNVLPFSGQYSDLEPCFTTDGKYLLFSSNRPLDNEVKTKDFDLWKVQKTREGWSDPINLGPEVNSEYNEFYPSVSEDMTLYFCSKNENCIGGEDLWYSEEISSGQWGKPQNLGDSLNTASDEYNAFIHPQERYIVFTTHGWGKGVGSGDLWISFRNDDGTWRRPKNLGPIVNTTSFEYSPSISADGGLLFFTSNQYKEESNEDLNLSFHKIKEFMMQPDNGSQNIYCIKTDFIENNF